MHIISLLPSATEIVYALDLADELAGVTHECDYPVDALEKPRLTRSHVVPVAGADETVAASIDRQVRESLHDGHSLYALDDDLLAQLKPDLIVTQELCDVCAVSSRLLRGTLERLGLSPRILSLEPVSLEGVYHTILDVGAAAGAGERAASVVERLRVRVRRLRDRTRALTPLRTLILEWTDPPMGSGHWTPNLVEIAGGTPVLGWPGEYSRAVSWDDIRAADPECIIVAPCGMNLTATLAAIDDLQRTNSDWRELMADRWRRVVALDGNQFVNRPGPRLVDTAELFALAIHPEIHHPSLDDKAINAVMRRVDRAGMSAAEHR